MEARRIANVLDTIKQHVTDVLLPALKKLRERLQLPLDFPAVWIIEHTTAKSPPRSSFGWRTSTQRSAFFLSLLSVPARSCSLSICLSSGSLRGASKSSGRCIYKEESEGVRWVDRLDMSVEESKKKRNNEGSGNV